jgi:CubicO group peptidase (beta-lactamase class C family)
MTATLAARLVDKGLIDWRSTIGDVLGGRVADMQPAYRDLNLLHLLSHHGGLARDTPPAAYRDAPRAEQRLAFVRAALELPPLGPAERQMAYSNNDYVVAGLMLETVGRAPWEVLITREVFEPMGLRSAGFGPPGAVSSLDQPQGHRMGRYGLEPVRSDIPDAMAPAGQVNMNLHDLVLYLTAHRDQPTGFLRPDAWRTLHRPPFEGDYALGWEVSDKGVLFHGGTNSWWKSEVRVDPGAGVVCAAVANVLNNNTQSALLQLEDAAER